MVPPTALVGLPHTWAFEPRPLLRDLVPAGMTMAQMAQRWILDFDAVSVIIPGASSPAQARENASVAGLPPLSVDLHDALREFYHGKVHDHIRGPY